MTSLAAPGSPLRALARRAAGGFALAGLLGCSAGVPPEAVLQADRPLAMTSPAWPESSRAIAAAPDIQPLTTLAGIEHYRRWSERIAQGGQPAGEQAFAALASEGFRTVLSVDGALPDVETAGRHGLRYVHVPIGYDGVEPDEQLRIVKAVQESEGPVFVHCHHGLHRGPAAAAIARMVSNGVAAAEAHAGLRESGCSPSYAGLFRDVLAFQAPDPSAIAALPALPAQVLPEGVRASMVRVDEYWDLVTAIKGAGWAVPAEHPDVVPALQAQMLREQFRELARIEESQARGPEFLALLQQAEDATASLASALEQGRSADAAKAYDALKASCKSCHASYRD